MEEQQEPSVLTKLKKGRPRKTPDLEAIKEAVQEEDEIDKDSEQTEDERFFSEEVNRLDERIDSMNHAEDILKLTNAFDIMDKNILLLQRQIKDIDDAVLELQELFKQYIVKK